MRDVARFKASRNCSLCSGVPTVRRKASGAPQPPLMWRTMIPCPLQFLAQTASLIAHSAEQEVRPRRRHLNSRLRESFGQKLRAHGIGFRRRAEYGRHPPSAANAAASPMDETMNAGFMRAK